MTAHDGTLILWDADSGEERKRFDDLRQQFRSVDWLADGSRIAAGSVSGLSVWDAASGMLAIRVPDASTSVLWSPEGTRLANGGEGRLQILDSATNDDRPIREDAFPSLTKKGWTADRLIDVRAMTTLLARMRRAKTEGRDDHGHSVMMWAGKGSPHFELPGREKLRRRGIAYWLDHFGFPNPGIDNGNKLTRNSRWDYAIAMVKHRLDLLIHESSGHPLEPPEPGLS